MKATALQAPRSVRREGQEMLQVLQPVVRQAVPLLPMEVHGEAETHSTFYCFSGSTTNPVQELFKDHNRAMTFIVKVTLARISGRS